MAGDITFGGGYNEDDTPIAIDADGKAIIKSVVRYDLVSRSSDKSSLSIPLPEGDGNGSFPFDPIIASVAPPTARFDFVSYEGFNVQFINESIGSIDVIVWDFGDGTFSTAKNPLHKYSAEGTYVVILKVINSGGSSTFVSYVTTVAPTPEVNFNFAIGGFTVYFNNLSNTTNWQWDFGDGTFSTEENPTHVYSASGNYTVILRSGSLEIQKVVEIDVEILLEWLDNSDNETGFKIEHSLNGVDGWTQIADLGTNITSYGVTLLKDGVDSTVVNFFRIKAYNGAGDSGYSNIANVTCGV